MREYEKVVVRKRAESELNRASYGHLKSSQQKSTEVNKKSASQGWRAAPIEWRAAPLVTKFSPESSSGQRAREARRAFRNSRVARRACYVARRARCFFRILGARLLNHFWPLDLIQGSIFAPKTSPKPSYTLIQRRKKEALA